MSSCLAKKEMSAADPNDVSTNKGVARTKALVQSCIREGLIDATVSTDGFVVTGDVLNVGAVYRPDAFM